MARARSADEGEPIGYFSQPFRAKRKTGHPRLAWEDVIKKDLKEIETFWEGVKREALNILG
jgi:hypothetical protein